MRLLQLAGLQVEQGFMKKSSIKDLKSPEDKPRKRWSVPLNTPPPDTKPVNRKRDETNMNVLSRRSFTVYPKASKMPFKNRFYKQLY